MRITKVTPYLMQAGAPSETAWSAQGMSAKGSRHWCFVRIDTDEGLHGIGEGSGWPKLVHAALTDFAPLLAGEDPRHIDRLWHKLFVAQMGHGMTGTPGAGALAAIDMALWDLNGKALGVPVWRLLGGRFRDRIPAYVHAGSAESARTAVSEGYRIVKAGNVRGTVDKVARLREAVGPEIDIAVDLHGPPWLGAADALRLARALEPYDILFLEDPVAPEDIDGWRRVRQGTDLPLAAGERWANLWQLRTLLSEGLVDIVQPDTGRVGLTQLRKMAALAEAHFAHVAPHAGTLGPVAEFAAIHLLAAIPNAGPLERFRVDWPGRAAIVTAPVEIDDGQAVVPDRPGLGVDLILEEVARHPPGTNVNAPSAHTGMAYEDGTADEHLYQQPRRRRAAFFNPTAASELEE